MVEHLDVAFGGPNPADHDGQTRDVESAEQFRPKHQPIFHRDIADDGDDIGAGLCGPNRAGGFKGVDPIVERFDEFRID